MKNNNYCKYKDNTRWVCACQDDENGTIWYYMGKDNIPINKMNYTYVYYNIINDESNATTMNFEKALLYSHLFNNFFNNKKYFWEIYDIYGEPYL